MLFLELLLRGLGSCKRTSFLLNLVIFSTPLFSQILPSSSNTIRLFHGTSAIVTPQADSTSIGNYGVLDPQSKEFNDLGKEIASKSSGTMFLVIRPKFDTLPNERLLKVGPISLYSDSLKIDGQKLDIEPIKKEPVIVKVKYQAKPRRSWFSKSFKLGDAIGVAELVYFEELLNNEQIRKVETLLALKYSIKIDKICDKKLPDYVSLPENRVWNYKSDEDYDKQIMGLGRLDRASFLQSQSYSPDSRSVKISLDSMMAIGESNSVFIQDSSLLVLSQGNDHMKSQCGGNPADFLFKLQLFNWDSEADTLLLELDTALAYNAINLSDGVNYSPVEYKVLGGKTFFGVPIVGLEDETNYFIVGMKTQDTCPPLYDLQFFQCDSAGENKLSLSIEPSALPAECKIINLYTGVVFDTIISNQSVLISDIVSGNYELFVSNSNGSIIHSLFKFDECPSSFYAYQDGDPSYGTYEEFGFNFENNIAGSSSSNESLLNQNGFNGFNGVENGSFQEGQSGLGSDEEAILIFPNPIRRAEEVTLEFRNLNEIPFTIQVMDNKGAILHEGSFTPSVTNRTYNYQIDQPGTFLLRAVSPSYTSVQTIVVK